MKLGKEQNEEFLIVTAETEKDVDKFLRDGYLPIAETDKPSETAVCTYVRVSNGYVQVWNETEDHDTMAE